jgi:hypothetical protein
MSAIKEWFGIYNMLFRHMKETYGEQELRDYLDYLADTAYSDVSSSFKAKGLAQISERYTDNFIKDGGMALRSEENGILGISVISCPAYSYMLASRNPYDKPEQYYCDCCCRLNSRILSNSGYLLEVTDISNNGKCVWKIEKEPLNK